MAAKKKGLGRGLDLLIPEGNNTKQSKTEKESKPIIKEVVKEVVKEVKVPAETFLKLSDIEPNREQPRKNFDKEALEELADSIKQYGLIQPIVVQKKDDYYEIIAGERRWRAAKMAKLKEVPDVYKRQMLILKKVVDLVLKNGARTAEPGEFTKRAFLNGRIDLSQAEAVMDLINSKNDFALNSSIEQLKGGVSDAIKDIRKDIIYHIAYIESALDDPEHISLDGYDEEITEMLNENINKISKLDVYKRQILAFVSSLTSITTSLSGSLRTISEKILASMAILPASIISPSTLVSIPNSISLAVNLISPSVASIRMHSRIDIVVFDDTAFITILIPVIKSDFLQTSFIINLLYRKNNGT